MKRQGFHQQQNKSQSDIHPSSGWLQRPGVREVPENEVESPVGEYGLHRSFVNVPVHGKGLPVVQRKLTIGAAGDRYEQEADRVASQVVQQNSSQPAQLNALGVDQGRNIQVAPGKNQSIANEVSQKQNYSGGTFVVDNQPEGIQMQKLQEMANNSPQVRQLSAFQEMANNKAAQLQAMADNYSAQQQHPIQKKENKTGLPDNLKAGIENLSGYSLDDVKVHYNSNKPAQLNARAYAQGTEIHLTSGQEKHLPHEGWHVVQQKQGRVKPTMQLKGRRNINDDKSLEIEADTMGKRSMQLKESNRPNNNEFKKNSLNGDSIQLNGLDQEDYLELARAATVIIQNSINHVFSARGATLTANLIKDLVIDLIGLGSVFDTMKLAYYFLTGDMANARDTLYSILASLSGLDSIKQVLDGLIELDGGDGRTVLLKTKAYKKFIGKFD